MAKSQRFANAAWVFPTTDNGTIAEWQFVGIAVMMDVRDELKKLNALLHCQNFVAIPSKLDAINRKLPTRKKRKASKP